MEDGGHGSIVFELEDILFHILSNLSSKELDLIAQVNSTWYRTAKKIKHNRKKIAWCYYNKLDSGGVDKHIGLVLDNLPSEPHFALAFVSSNLEDRISVPALFSRSGTRCLPRAVKREEVTFSNYLERSLPPANRIAGIVSEIIVATRSSNHTVQHKDNDSSASCLFLPKLKGVDIYHFMLENNFGAGAKKTSFSAETGIPEDKCPKLILLFHADFYNWSGKVFFSKILRKHRDDVVIAGGSVDGLFTDRAFKLQNQNRCFGYEPFRLGVAFCGSGLHAVSVVIGENKNNEKLVEEELSRLKAVHVPEKCSVAFLFCDIMRLPEYSFDSDKEMSLLSQGDESVESKAFKKMFPDVPLFGFFGDTEVGFDHLPGNAGKKKRSATVDYSKINFIHEGTAIFVILYFP